MTRQQQIEVITGQLKYLDTQALEGLIKFLGHTVVTQETSEQVMDEESRAWHDADLSNLSDYEPYDWGDVDPMTIGEPLRLVKQ
jgi:hypothetical protein